MTKAASVTGVSQNGASSGTEKWMLYGGRIGTG